MGLRSEQRGTEGKGQQSRAEQKGGSTEGINEGNREFEAGKEFERI